MVADGAVVGVDGSSAVVGGWRHSFARHAMEGNFTVHSVEATDALGGALVACFVYSEW